MRQHNGNDTNNNDAKSMFIDLVADQFFFSLARSKGINSR